MWWVVGYVNGGSDTHGQKTTKQMMSKQRSKEEEEEEKNTCRSKRRTTRQVEARRESKMGDSREVPTSKHPTDLVISSLSQG
jgi:hypothetical protein